jgi:hypothetical protein
MKSTDLDTMKAAWKKEPGFEDKRLSEADIEVFLHSKSRNITQLFRKGLIFDVIFKSVVGLSLGGIIILFRANMHIILGISAVLLAVILAILYQWNMIGSVPENRDSEQVVRASLEKKVHFYHHRYIKSLYVGALSNSLLILSGMLYYYYFKYGEIRPFQLDDYLVFGAVIIIGYAVGAFAQISQHNFQVKQLENCLQEIDEDTLSSQTIREQQNKKKQLTRIFLLAILCGLILLAFIIFS